MLCGGRFDVVVLPLVGRLHYDGQRGLELAGLLHLYVICFHQIGMIAVRKKRHPLVFLPRELRQNRGTCVCLFCFLSKNENNNGFDTIGLNSSSFGYKRVVEIHFTVLFRTVFPSCFGLDWMRNLHNEHHLAAKNGTFSAC